MKGFKSAVIVAVLALLALAVASTGAPAAHAAAVNRVHFSGTVIDFSPHSLTIRVAVNDYQAVALTDKTVYVVDCVRSPKPQWRYGERVHIVAQRKASGALNALQVSVGNLRPGHVLIEGAISDFSAHALTIRIAPGDFRAVALTNGTKYIVNGKPSTKPAWHLGEEVEVVAARECSNALRALVVSVGPNDLVHLAGTISDFSRFSLTIRTGVLDYRVVSLTSQTRFYLNGKLVSNPTFHYGEEVHVTALRQDNGALIASVVRLTTRPSTQRTVAGTIIDFSDHSLTILTASGDYWAIALTGNTKYIVNGQPAPKPAWHYGEQVSALAHREPDGSLNALTVTV